MPLIDSTGAVIEAPPEQEAPGFWGTVGAGIRQENFGVSGFMALNDSMNRSHARIADIGIINPATEPDFAHYNRLGYGDALRDAATYGEYEIIRNRIDQEMRDDDILDRAGVYGVAARIAGGVLSPENAVPLAGMFGRASRGYGVLRQGLRVGGQAAAASALSEGLLHTTQKTRTLEESVYATLGSAALFGALGGTARFLSRGARDAAVRELHASFDAGKEAPDTLRQIAGRAIAENPERYAGKSVGAASRMLKTDFEASPDALFLNESGLLDKLANQVFRFSPFGRLLRSRVIGSNFLARALSDSPVFSGKLKHIQSIESGIADHHGSMLRSVHEADLIRQKGVASGDPELAVYSGSKGRALFERDVHDGLTNGDKALDEVVGEKQRALVKQGIDHWRAIHDKYFDLGVESGILQPWERVLHDPSYAPREWDHDAIAADPIGFENAIAKSWVERKGMAPDVAAARAKAYVNGYLNDVNLGGGPRDAVSVAGPYQARTLDVPTADVRPYTKRNASDGAWTFIRRVGPQIEFARALREFSTPAALNDLHIRAEKIVKDLSVSRGMPDWVVEGARARGLNPARPLNDFDLQHPGFESAVRNDPTLNELEKASVLATGHPRSGTDIESANDFLEDLNDLAAIQILHTFQGEEAQKELAGALGQIEFRAKYKAELRAARQKVAEMRGVPQSALKKVTDAVGITKDPLEVALQAVKDAEAKLAQVQENLRQVRVGATELRRRNLQGLEPDTDQFIESSIREITDPTELADAVHTRTGLLRKRAAMDAVNLYPFISGNGLIARQYRALKAKADAGDRKAMKRLQDLQDRDISDAKFMRDKLLGRHNRDTTWLGPWVRAAHRFNYMTMMGSVVLSSLADMAMPIFTAGLRPTIGAWMKLAENPIANLKAALLDPMNFNSRGRILEQIFTNSASTEIVLHSMRDESLFNVARMAGENWAERAANWTSEKFSPFTLYSRWNNVMRDVATQTSMTKIFNIAERHVGGQALSATDLANLAAIRLNVEDLPAIHAQFMKYGQMSGKSRFFNGRRYAIAGSQKWDDTAVRDTFARAVMADVNQTIIRPSAGDAPKWVNNDIARLLFQFQGYAAAATNRILARGLAQRDAQVFEGAVGMMLLATLGETLKIAASGGRSLPQENGKFDYGKFASRVVRSSGVPGYFGEMASWLTQVTGRSIQSIAKGEKFKPAYALPERVAGAFMGGPTFGQISRGLSVGQDVGRALREWNLRKGIKERTLDNLDGLINPFSGLFYAKWLFNIGEGETAKALGLKRIKEKR